MHKNTLREIKLGSGAVIPAGTPCTLEIHSAGIRATHAGGTAKLGWRNAKANFGAPFTTVPTLRTLEKWSNDGIARSTMGAKVEPDGTDANGAPSWLLALGMI